MKSPDTVAGTGGFSFSPFVIGSLSLHIYIYSFALSLSLSLSTDTKHVNCFTTAKVRRYPCPDNRKSLYDDGEIPNRPEKALLWKNPWKNP